MNLFEEVADIAEKEFDKWTHKELTICTLRLLALELFIRIQETKDGKPSHVWLTSSNHPLLLRVFGETEQLVMSKQLLDTLTEKFMDLLDVDIDTLEEIVATIINPEEEEQ